MFETKKVNMNSLGEHLAELRSKFGYNHKEVSTLSQVQPKYIEALEKDDFDNLPADVYVLGFLKSLADVYKTSEQKLVEYYRHQKQINENLVVSQIEQKKDSPLPKFVLSSKTITVGLVGMVALFSFGYLLTQINSLNQPPDLTIYEPAEDGQVDQGLIIIRGEAEPGAEVSINNQFIVVDADGSFVENISLAPGSNQILFEATNRFGQSTKVNRTIVYREKAVAGTFVDNSSDTQIETPEPEESRASFSLTLSVEEEAAWVSVSDGERVVFSGTMLAGSSRTFSNYNEIVLTTGNAGATRVLINDIDQGFMGKFGEVVRDKVFNGTDSSTL